MPRRRLPPPASSDDLLSALGQLTAQALERVELQRARVELARALQREFLPAALPSVPGLRPAARYAPARHGLDIGGDWYDGFVMPDGALGFSIGDVQGHDVEAAALMGQVRIVLHALATVTSDPGEVLSHANDLLLSMDRGLFATCCLLRYDPASGELAAARAGHVPAVWASGDGTSGIAEAGGGLPLGIMPGEAYPVTRRTLTGSGAIALVTDGVVEGPTFELEAGLERVRASVLAGVGGDPADLATEVIGLAEITGHADDAAVLVLRHDEPARADHG
ncbi:PP2C family protein-serine/threonine phosphatase [Streptacidiphilus rugosus]|uniref:PP2C family protein-serine/threonine phosphatase n=1 Tax=Streptacidiphilus rugosus TaxID=405783 RepID=UPI000564C90E|nr:PP2C family protein-serine/threonine phosphatase [Streptacidiphilus rugosus]